MKITLNTEKLKEMVSKAVKGCSNNKMFPLTSLLGIELKKQTLIITSTDMANYLYMIQKGVDGEDFYVSVPADIFSKLVANTTSDSITLNVQDNYLEVIGNGTYKISLVLDENGQVVRFPNYTEKLIDTRIGMLPLNTARVILNSLKPSLATTLENPAYTNYFVGDSVVATDTQVVSAMDSKIFSDAKDPLFISSELMDLLAVITEDNIDVRYDGKTIEFVTDTCMIHGESFDYMSDFRIDDVLNVTKMPFESSCKIYKSAFLQLIDRISLFIGDYDESAVTMKFTSEGIMLESKANLGEEIIPYVEINDFKDFAGDININIIKTQVKAQASDMLEIWFGNDMAIKMVDGNIVSIIGLITDDI